MTRPDPRWQNFVGEIFASGRSRSITQADLWRLTKEWADLVADTPSFGATELLEQARSHVVNSWWDYNLMATACLAGLQAVEATFRQILYPDKPERTPFRHLVEAAVRDEWFSQKKAAVITAGVELRNHSAHPQGAVAFTPGLTDSILTACHLVVRDICEMKGLTDSSDG